MSLRITLTAVAVFAALAPATAAAHGRPGGTNLRVWGVMSGTAFVNTATVEVGADMRGTVAPFGPVTGQFRATGTRTDGIVRATGPFSLTARDGASITGTATLVGAGPNLNVHPAAVAMVITGGTGRFEGATGALSHTPLITPLLPFVPPLLNERLESMMHGYVSY
jgi:hypothetical protein